MAGGPADTPLRGDIAVGPTDPAQSRNEQMRNRGCLRENQCFVFVFVIIQMWFCFDLFKKRYYVLNFSIVKAHITRYTLYIIDYQGHIGLI